MPGDLLGLAENPFSEGHDARFLYPSRAHWEAVTRLRRAVDNREPFVYLTGPPGCGKTTALLEFLAGLESHTAVVIVATPSLTLTEFRARMLSGLGVESAESVIPERTADRVEASLRELHARGEVVVLVVDESQNLCPEVLEELMVLSDLEVGGQKLLQIVLAGQPVLERLLSSPGCEALRPRIAERCWLGAFSAEETEGYILHRVSVVSGASRSLFPSESCQAAYRLTHGIPRDINLLASEALAQAAAGGATSVKPDHVAAAAKVTGLVPPEAAAWVARFGHACDLPEIDSRIGAARSLFEMLESGADEAAERSPSPPSLPQRPAAGPRAAPGRGTTRRGRPWRAGIWAAAALLVVAVGFVLSLVSRNLKREGAAHRPAGTSPAAETNGGRAATEPRGVPSAGSAAVSPAPTAAVPLPVLAPRRSRPESPTSRPGAAAKAVSGAPAARAPAPRFGIELATFIVESRAVEERDKLAARLSVACRVVTSLEDDAVLYHVVVGPLTSRSEAESLAVDLSARRVVGEARVVRWTAADSTRR